ncbi:hypothetical protein [Geobacter sp.]|uniref:hypothetical protein n=1 Tax=Geobacter sp. TaxID=46610 RepID=UPI0027B9D06B|nr:hypothetical protein [Geobacter sp.]
MDDEKELERLRLEFLKRGEDAGAVYRARLALENQDVPAIVVDYPTESSVIDRVKLLITVNMFSTLEEIERALCKEVMNHIRFHKELMMLDCPESEKPQFKKGKGQSKSQSQIEEIRTCLKVHDLIVSGHCRNDIVSIVYGNQRKTEKELAAWGSDYQKVVIHGKKALDLIESAISSKFPSTPSSGKSK